MDVLALLDSDAAVRTLRPEMNLLARVNARGVIVTAPAADERYDFVSRFFAPRYGIAEDPVTGWPTVAWVRSGNDGWPPRRFGRPVREAAHGGVARARLRVDAQGDGVSA